MTNYICEGEVLEVVAAAPINSGDVIPLSAVVGVATTSGAIGDVVAVRIKGVFSVAKLAGTAWVQGDKLYWDAVAKNATEVTAGNTFMGYAYQVAQAGDVTGFVKLIY